VRTARAVVGAGRTAAQAAEGLRRPDGGLDARAVRDLGALLREDVARAGRELTALRDVRTGLTPPPVPGAVREARSELGGAVAGLRRAAALADLGPGLLGADRPRSVLVALANNAELRGTGGYVSTFATGVLVDGRLELGPFRDVEDVLEPPERARRVPAPPSFVEDYGPYLADTTFWRMWTMTPHGPDAGQVGAEVAGLLLGTRPDVVLVLDVPAVAALAALSGAPVTLPDGTSVPPQELADALLVETYASAGADELEQSRRRAALREAAGASAAALLGADLDLPAAARELGRLARGRHLVVWSADPAEQARLEELGAAGSLRPPVAPGEQPVGRPDDVVGVFVSNLSANKLDPYVRRSVRADVVLGPDAAEVVTTVRLEQTAPADLVPYVAGRTSPGESDLRVELSLPREAQVDSLVVDGAPALGDLRTGPDRTRAFAFTRLGRGQVRELVLRHRVPVQAGRYRLHLVPQALARDAELEVVVRPAEGGRLALPEEAAGFAPHDDGLRRAGPWSAQEVVALRWERGSLVDRAVRWLTEPVSLG
jgi:hypothetical protein